MKLESLKKKLTKIGVTFESRTKNGYNYELVFTINGKLIEAPYDKEENVSCYICQYGYNEASQESTNLFFYSFGRLVRFQ